MNKKTTRELFDDFFSDTKPDTEKKTRPQIDRPEVYAYEKKIGKQLIEMDVDELFDMLLTFNNNKNNNGDYGLSLASYNQISSMYRAFFQFYIEKYEVIKNPFNNKRMKGIEAEKRLRQGKKVFDWDAIKEIIDIVHNEYDETKANYIECIMLLFYNGFARAKEIVNLEEDMIDFKNKTVRLPGRTLQLSDRCFELLVYVHNLTSMKGWYSRYIMLSWHGKYFKYFVRPKESVSFDDRSEEEIANSINFRLLKDVKKKFGIEINYRILYLRGFYDRLIQIYGAERSKEMVTSIRNPEDIEELMKAAREYGVNIDNISQLKRYLRPFAL